MSHCLLLRRRQAAPSPVAVFLRRHLAATTRRTSSAQFQPSCRKRLGRAAFLCFRATASGRASPVHTPCRSVPAAVSVCDRERRRNPLEGDCPRAPVDGFSPRRRGTQTHLPGARTERRKPACYSSEILESPVRGRWLPSRLDAPQATLPLVGEQGRTQFSLACCCCHRKSLRAEWRRISRIRQPRNV
jgi:hypothetical protein